MTDRYIGRLLDDRYEILDVLGTGGMAVVYKARCHRLNRLVAIKILKDEFSGNEEFRSRFRAEGEAVAMLSHPNIVQVYDVSTSDSANFIVMELIDGISLKQYMEKKGVLNWKETLHFSMQIAKGLEHAHSRGIVHRDIKPHNVMVLKNGSVKVMDFGIARVMNKSNTLTKEALGSVHYISPEQAKGGHTDNRSDLYSLGVVMYEMMAGRPPYDGESAVAVAIQHINGGAVPPSSWNPNIPSGLEQIIMKAMSLEIRDRYVSATEMLQDMEEFRKNPAIVFSYQSTIDGATRNIPSLGAVAPVTTAEKVVQAKHPRTALPESRPNAVVQRPSGSAPGKDDARSRAQHKKRDEQAKQEKKKEERNRVATTAIVICSVVGIIAIVIFLFALFNGLLLDKEKDLVEVPYLQGQTYDENFSAQYPDFQIRTLPQRYHDTFLEDQIISQEPAGGEKVQRGSDIWIVVSMGPEPAMVPLDELMGVPAEEAVQLLKDQGFNPLTKKEPSYIYDPDTVTRTDPAAGTELAPGQTVYVYVSTGPEIVESVMPNVVGLEKDRAKNLLDSMGFKNVRYEQTESQKPINEVVYQSVKSNEEIDVNTEIIIQYSQGLMETEPTEASIPEQTTGEQTHTVTFNLPEREEEYRLDICIADTEEIIHSETIRPGTTSTLVDLSGSGTVYYDLYINGEFESQKKVTFSNE